MSFAPPQKKPDVKSNSSFRSNQKKPKIHPLMEHHQTIGNQGMQRLLKFGILQAKLKISQPNDPYEIEADKVADQIMRMPEQNISANDRGEKINRKYKRYEEEKIKISRKPSSISRLEASDHTSNEINSLKGSGRTIDIDTESLIESRFEFDFSKVRIHDDSRSHELAEFVSARAFTVGNDIFFGKNESTSDNRLMTHELIHVIQNNSLHGLHNQNMVQREPVTSTRQDSVELQYVVTTSHFQLFNYSLHYNAMFPVEDTYGATGTRLKKLFGPIILHDEQWIMVEYIRDRGITIAWLNISATKDFTQAAPRNAPQAANVETNLLTGEPIRNARQAAPRNAPQAANNIRLEEYRGDHIVGHNRRRIRVDAGFVQSLNIINDIARRRGITVIVMQAVREAGQPVRGAVVRPARRSNHLAGHAIDFNLEFNERRYTSRELHPNNLHNQPEAIRGFINDVIQAGLRWGGNFTTVDPIHFDDGLNRDAAQFDNVRDLIQNELHNH